MNLDYMLLSLSHPVSVILVFTVLKAVHTETASGVSLTVPAIVYFKCARQIKIQIDVVVIN